ncbi:type II toxin-antitoxin system HicA family toxin [Halorarius litoreus]|uniref:type II toxin-antitoxin system HicA family toxin n=1 Tax=Halorarius litoreus TaxID=2962676 RepID=UPI003D9CB9F3
METASPLTRANWPQNLVSTRPKPEAKAVRRGTRSVGRTTFTGREVAKVLMKFDYEPKSRTGSHLTLEYVNPDTGEVRRPTVPLHGEIPRGTLGSIAEQCGAEDFHSFCEWIDDHC